jgi:hypothetical protein
VQAWLKICSPVAGNGDRRQMAEKLLVQLKTAKHCILVNVFSICFFVDEGLFVTNKGVLNINVLTHAPVM